MQEKRKKEMEHESYVISGENNIEPEVNETTENNKTVYLKPLKYNEADFLKGKKLLSYLKAYNIKQSGTADEKRFKLRSYLMYKELTEPQKEIIRKRFADVIGKPKDVYNDILEEIEGKKTIEDDTQRDIASYVIDWEACYIEVAIMTGPLLKDREVSNFTTLPRSASLRKKHLLLLPKDSISSHYQSLLEIALNAKLQLNLWRL